MDKHFHSESIRKIWKYFCLNNDGKRLERLGEVRVVDETNGFGLDFVKKTESGFWSTTPEVRGLL